MDNQTRTALFPGSFDPFTRGHEVFVRKALSLFDSIVIGVGENVSKRPLLDLDSRIRLIRDVFAKERRISVTSYSTLTGDYCRECGIRFILRGLRSHEDFAYEMGMAQTNAVLFPDLCTVFIPADQGPAMISSSTVRELHAFGKDTSMFLPDGIRLENYL